MDNTLSTFPADKSLLAAIDLGSNSFRLEIGKLDGGQIQPLRRR
jgi:exopolyphosphatase / guanosine-5'-triphosphate,3'-diphosphate pyrophosphatase